MIDLHEGVLGEFAERRGYVGDGWLGDESIRTCADPRGTVLSLEPLPSDLRPLERRLLAENARRRALDVPRVAAVPKARKRSAEYLAKHAERNRAKWRAKHWGGQTKQTQTESKAA